MAKRKKNKLRIRLDFVVESDFDLQKLVVDNNNYTLACDYAFQVLAQALPEGTEFKYNINGCDFNIKHMD